MEIFKIKLTKIVKNRDWEVKHLFSSRKRKVCAYCGKEISDIVKNTSFTKRTNVGARVTYETYYTHGHEDSQCTTEMRKKLGL